MKKRKFKLFLLGIFLITIGLYLSIPDGKMRMVFCDVGQGDGAIIIKGNWQMVIDTGADNGKMERCLDRFVPFWDRKIEGVIISHWDKDHSGSFSRIIKNYKVEHLFESVSSGEEIEQNIYTDVLRAGDVIKYETMYFEVVSPNEIGEIDNENSLVVVLNYRNKRFLFTGDAGVEGEGKMMSWWSGKVEGLKVSHHGSDTATSEEWLKRIQPAVAVISVGENSYGHPNEEVLERLNRLGIKILRTDLEGDIVLGWD